MLLTGQTDNGMNRAAWSGWYDEALGNGTAFVRQQSYLYPTYSRDKLWWERVAFWIDLQFETPQSPAGLEPAGKRSTYGDANADG